MEPLKLGVRTASLAVLLATTACTGVISEAGGSGAPGQAPGAGGLNGSGGTNPGPGAGTGAGEGTIGGAPSAPPTHPGVMVVRRLNRAEYDNTVRDLLGTTLRPAAEFPADDLGGEFDTVGSALSLSPAYVSAYEKAAYTLIDDLFAADSARQQRVVSCNVATEGDSCARTILGNFARRAWRRPLTAAENDALMGPVTRARELSAPPLVGLKHALAGVLMSPFFIFKLELETDPASTEPRRLTSHELATRLSYALWATMPDDTLFAAADAGTLSTDADLAAQVDRMLADRRSEALIDNFAADWLDFRHLESHEVESAKFPSYTPAVAESMKQEARRFVQEFLTTDRPVSEMLNSRFTFADATLATHYGLSRPTAPAAELVRVDTAAAPRAGLLTLGAFLTATSFASRTSPVVRGKFVFDRLLCGTVALPPGDTPTLPEDPTLTGRALAEQHRSKPECLPCHQVMDPIGFGLENFDAIGAYRTKDGANDVDASGTLPDGSSFNGAIELANILARDPRFTGCVTNKFMTFAVGRLLSPTNQQDQAWVSYLAAQAQSAGSGSLRDIIRAVLLSDGFRMRQAAAPVQ